MEVQGEGRNRRIVAGCACRNRCGRGSGGNRARRECARRPGHLELSTSGEVKASPVIVEDKVIVGSYDGSLYCLSLKDGKPVWQFKTNGPVHATASVAAGLAYISGCDGVLRGIRISDGKEMIEITTGAYTGASPALAAGQAAYFGTFNNDV